MENTPSSTHPKNEPPKSNAAAAPAAGGTNGLAIASLVTGILAFLTGWFFLGLFLGIAAVILGAIGLKKPGGKGMSITGIITGALGALSGLVFSIIGLVALVSGGAILNEVTNELNNYSNEQQSLVDAKKDFAKGETAVFADLEVTAGEITRNYVPDNEFMRADDGNELVVVELTLKNISDETVNVSPYSYEIQVNGAGYDTSFVTVDPALSSGTLAAGAETTGNVVFEVPAGAENLKLQYVTYGIDKDFQTRTLTYTLAL
tara:strand:+ start:630 stop:1412 length:783 start_codon:yes stop_codon:yes gene_type:complete